MRNVTLLVLLVASLGVGLTTQVQGISESTNLKATKVAAAAKLEDAYQTRYILNTSAQLTGSTPQVVELQMPIGTTDGQFYLVDRTAGRAQPFVYKNTVDEQRVPFTVTKDGVSEKSLSDDSTATGTNLFMLSEGNGQTFSELEVTLQKPTELSGLSLLLDANSQPPVSVTVKGVLNNSVEEQVVFVNQAQYKSTFRFPNQTVSKLLITVGYTSSLRLTEVKLIQTDSALITHREVVRFLAQPDTDYILYTNIDPQQMNTGGRLEAGNLFARTQVTQLTLPRSETNPSYRPVDQDGDGILDAQDNCPRFANAAQVDADGNGVGDECDDYDVDGMVNALDNCPEVANRAQTDTDGDKIGDACDTAESRLTEQNPWLPWAAMGGTAVIIGGLFYSVINSKKFETSKRKLS